MFGPWLLGALTLAAGALASAPAHDSIAFVVFYDQNGNGRLDPDEKARLPGVAVAAAGQEALSEARTGRAVLTGVPAGTYDVAIRTETLPPFFALGTLPSIQVPARAPVPIPATLGIGSNRPNVYAAFGDSITDGEGSSDGAGYRSRLQAKLRAHFGQAVVVNEGEAGTVSHHGARRIAKVLERDRPACLLVLYGTNDWDETREEPDMTSATINSLRRILRQARAGASLPFLATLVPTHPGRDARASPERNHWIAATNVLIRGLAAEEGAVLVDLEAAFARAADASRLYADGLHPGDRGYELIARAFFDAITTGRPAAATTSERIVR